MNSRHMKLNRWTTPLTLGLVALMAWGCQPAQEADEAEPAFERAENAQLGFAIGAVPEGLKVDVNEGSRLELVPADPALGGRLELMVGEPVTLGGVNLVAAYQAHKEDINSRTDGEYKGQRELIGMPMGTSFYSRGRYTAEDGTATEETIVFFVHPLNDRTLEVVYRYPAGEDSAIRLQEHLFEVAAALEPLDTLPTAPADDAGDASDGTAQPVTND